MQNEVMKPKSTGKLTTKTQNKQPNTKKKDLKPNPQDLSRPSKIPHSISKQLVPGAGDCASLVCRFVTARLPVKPDVESLCPLWAPFRPSDDDESKNPISVGGSRWVSKREIRLGSDIRSGRRWCRRGGDGDETRKNNRENDQANIGVVRYDFGKTDLHPQVAEGDGRTLISIGG
jgi:hypothetical protein